MASTDASLPVAIVGGGLTGLAAAWQLVQKGRRVRLFETALQVGGVIQTERTDGWLVEAGPNSLQESATLAGLFTQLGLDPAKCHASPAARQRYIVRGGRPRAAPLSPGTLLRTELFSAAAKIRMAAELFRRPIERAEDVSLAEFGRYHFGAEFGDYALNPFVSGIYAGDPEKLSARHAFPLLWEMERSHGSLLRAGIARARAARQKGGGSARRPPRILSFHDGLEQLPRAFAAQLPAGSVELGATVTQLAASTPWTVTWTRGGLVQTEACASVLLAVPAGSLARIEFTGQETPHPLSSLAEIEHAAVSSLFLGYRREQVEHPLDGFGMLVPAREHRSLLGVLFPSSLFPGRAPAGHVALTVLTGGSRRPDLAHLPDSELLPLVQRELAELLGVRGDPVFVRRRIWPRAIPQYTLGYERHLETMKQTEREHPGLHIGGNARDGIAMSACIASGLRLAGCVTGD